MSLESDFEEERLNAINILEESNNKQWRTSKSPDTYKRPVSLILNDDEEALVDRDNERRATSPPRCVPATSSGSGYDPLDRSAGDGYYYSSQSVRKGSTFPRDMANLSLGDTDIEGKDRSGSQDDIKKTSNFLNEMDFSRDRRRSPLNQSRSEGSLGDLYRTSSGESQLANHYDTESSDSDPSDESDSDSASDEDSPDTLDTSAVKEVSTGQIKSLLGAAEEERKAIEASKFKVKSLLDVHALPPGGAPPPSMAEYAAYKRRIIHPNTAFDTDNIDSSVPYTAAGEEARDVREAAKLEVEVSQIQSNPEARRMIRTMKRGNLPSLSDPTTPKLKSFIVASDLSPAATHALEWTIGTVLRDGNVLVIVCAFEDDGSGTASVLEEERLEAMNKLTTCTIQLLKKTPLQVHVVMEVLHCRTPRHVLTEIIDHVNPTLVILGSRGRSAIKGVLLGSFSNYFVERSSVPVMVVRKKLQKNKNKGLNVRLANNLRTGSLSSAKVD